MRTLLKTMFVTCALAATASVLPAVAQAAEAAVKVSCGNNNCNNVTLGQICDTFVPGSAPVALACENTATPGSGTPRTCGINGTVCRPVLLNRAQLLGDHCFSNNDAGVNDSIVTCDSTPTALSADGAGGKEPNATP